MLVVLAHRLLTSLLRPSVAPPLDDHTSQAHSCKTHYYRADYDRSLCTQEQQEDVAVSSNPLPAEPEHQREVLGPLVRVMEEAASDEPWALIGAGSCWLQGVDAASPNLELMTTEPVMRTLAEMLDVDALWQRSSQLAAERLHFMRDGIAIFIFANPTFHGNYDALTPLEIPSLWDARTRIEVGSATVLATPLEWELLLAVVLGTDERVEALETTLRDRSADGRLMTRLLREGRVESATEEAVWSHVERTG